MSKLTVDAERIYSRIHAIAEFGKTDEGMYCLGFSKEEDAAHALAKQYMEDAGMRTRTDAAGNLIGRYEGLDPKAPVVMTGSHLDTVFGGGIFDGRLGVIGAIEAVKCMHDQGIKNHHPIEVCVYRNEEGCRFHGGSSASFMTGRREMPDVDALDPHGVSMGQALRERGIDPERMKEALLPKGYAKAHVELHIEQSRLLESLSLPVGVVTGIFLLLRGEFIIHGMASHAGATPMDLRKDALCAASEIILAMEEEGKRSSGGVATVGSVTPHPGGVNIIPGRVNFSVDIRHEDPKVRDAIMQRVLKRADEICAKRGVTYEFITHKAEAEARPCQESVMAVISDACKASDLEPYRLVSGAGHDTGSFSGRCPIGMIFTRIKDGLSHHPDEYCAKEDCAKGTEVLYHTLIALAKEGTL